MSSKKVIGIPGWKVGENSFGVTTTYLQFISRFGNPKIILPHEEFADIDVLVLPGGLDVNPSSYNEVPGFNTSNTDVFKQHFYDKRLKTYIEKDTPILGICLGAQMLASYFGSKLTQDLLYHEQSPSRWTTAHTIFARSELGRTMAEPDKKGVVKLEVNSHHHQAVLEENLSSELESLFGSYNPPVDGGSTIVEVFKHKQKYIYGIQYHPEELYDDVSQNIMKLLVNL